MYIKPNLTALVTILAVITGTASTHAAEESEAISAPDVPIFLSVKPTSQYSLETDYDGVDLSVFRSGVNFNLTTFLSQTSSFHLDFNFEYSNYNFDKLGNVPGLAGIELDNAYQYRINPEIRVQHSRKIAYYAKALLTWSSTQAGDLSHAFYAGGIAAVKYKVSDTMYITAGVGAVDQFESNVRVFPAIGIEWDISPTLKLEVEGLKGTLTHKYTDKVDLFAFVRFDARQYRIRGGVTKRGALHDDRLIIGGGFTYKPNNNTDIKLEVGLIPYSEIKIESRSGADIFEEEGDLTGYIGGSIKFRF